MMILHYKLPCIPPSNNQFIGRNKRWEYQNAKKSWVLTVKACCIPKPAKPIEKSIVTLVYHFPDNRLRDPDNYSGKMILDGLTAAGIIKDDSFECIELRLQRGDNRKPAMMEIFIEGS